MNLYIDTEFTSFRGELISLAIIDENDNYFYEVLKWDGRKCHPWVLENVIPYLDREPIEIDEFQKRLFLFLRNYNNCNFYADWPEDIGFLLMYMCKPEGVRVSGEFNFHLIKSGNIESKVPHNALWDAIALKDWHVNSR